MKDDRALPQLSVLDFYQPEITGILIYDLDQGRALTERAKRDGCAFFPISRTGFLVAAPFLILSPDFACFHVELTDFHIKSYGRYTGGMLCICDGARISAETLIERFHFAGLLTTVKDAATNLEGCIAEESYRIPVTGAN